MLHLSIDSSKRKASMSRKSIALAFAASLIVINAFGQFVNCAGTSSPTWTNSTVNVGVGGTSPTNALHIFTSSLAQAQGLTIEGVNPALKFQPIGCIGSGAFWRANPPTAAPASQTSLAYLSFP